MTQGNPLGDDLIAVTMRDGIIDCVHYGSAVLIDSNGAVIWKIGNPNRLVFERSTTKPFRALAIIRAGVIDAFGLDNADIALISGSHSGTRAHVAQVRRILDKCGITEEDLRCGTWLPLGEDGLFELDRKEFPIGPLHCDCSGEHAGTLALCLHRGYDLSKYLEVNHPVQQEFLQVIKEFSDSTGNDLPIVADRCGMPTSPVSLITLASRIIRLISVRKNDISVARLLNAIRNNPFTYTGRGRLIGELIARSDIAVIGKCGAEGVYTVGWLESGVALAVKVADGNHRAAIPVIEQAANAAGILIPVLRDCINQGAFAMIGPSRF